MDKITTKIGGREIELRYDGIAQYRFCEISGPTVFTDPTPDRMFAVLCNSLWCLSGNRFKSPEEIAGRLQKDGEIGDSMKAVYDAIKQGTDPSDAKKKQSDDEPES